ncbi:LysM domain-containing protein [Flavobacterium sp. SUN046]|uniref:LysM peptidoglycan-binding domain-containing protein n=1 Tax=Flavobacterium sp. SUN046 TaxID=3002440 RepID=UPI002DBA16EF|nr:LysM domain-containing protein [Flavobacterium sp. SUN046]MEC4050105.1 LysM domain-containing protein [Flavobacterium sp. SUN046]
MKVFSLLNSISKSQSSKIERSLIIGISILSIALLGLFLKSNSARNELYTRNVILNDRIAKIQSIKIADGKGEPLTDPIAGKQDVIIKYKVKKGDYPYKIAQFFYNDGNNYKQIEADNNLEKPYTLKVGQVLDIKILQE